jgi:site-specific DNA-cytosine methylase
MIYGSVCSGIEAATVAWRGLGWKPAFFSEIEKFPCKLLNHYYPQIPNIGDMTKADSNEDYQQSTINLLVGGTPCQSFSVAGLRAGLNDKRGNLALEYCRMLIVKKPKWFVWENVPGVLTSFSTETESDESEVWETSDFANILTAFSGMRVLLRLQGVGRSILWSTTAPAKSVCYRIFWK